MYDAFICHASEDKDDVAQPLAVNLEEQGLSVWYDAFALRMGDDLLAEIDKGLRSSRFGIVILSHHFFAKHWTRKELGALAQLEVENGRTMILPIWHKIDSTFVRRYSPLLANRVAGRTSKGIGVVAQEIVKRVTTDGTAGPTGIPDDLETDLRARVAEVSSISATAGVPVEVGNQVFCPRCRNPVPQGGTNHYQCEVCALNFIAA